MAPSTTPPDWADIAHREHQLRIQREAEAHGWEHLCRDAIQAVKAVRQLHTTNSVGTCDHCVDGYGSPVTAPCPTIQALDQALLAAWGLDSDEPTPVPPQEQP